MDPLSHSLRSLCSLQHLFILQFGADRPANVLYFSSTQVGRHPRKVLQNFRSIISGVLYQFLFNQKLSTPQWWSLVLLTVGAMSKEVSLESGLHFNISSTGSKNYHNPNYACNFQNKALMGWSNREISTFCTFSENLSPNSSALPFISIQIVASCTASVYNEYLIKSKDVNFWVQNMFFYSNSILINFVFFICSNDTAANNLAPLLQTPGMKVNFWIV